MIGNPTLLIERVTGQHPFTAGVDEAGRGALAGAVVAGAVILDPENPIDGLRDSKALSEEKREQLFEYIQARSIAWAVGQAGPEEIDAFNILQATLLAMQRAVLALGIPPNRVLCDGLHCPSIPYEVAAVVRGDQTVEAISAASIVAKVTRDRQMRLLDPQFPEYGFAQHKGYGTKAHRLAIGRFGLSSVHRRSFTKRMVIGPL